MTKGKKHRKLSLKTDQRRALKLSLLRALVLKEKIQTTEAKAKEISPLAEKMVTKAKKGGLSQRRELLTLLSPIAVKKLMNDLAPRSKERTGGYTRVVKTGQRFSDGAKMAVVEFVK